MDLGLGGKRVLITGAGAGIGQAIALVLANEGAHVIVNDLSSARCRPTLDLLRENGHQAEEMPFDVGNERDATNGIDATEYLDVLVNNAAVMVSNLSFVDKPVQDVELEIQTSLFGTLNCSRAVLPRMIDRGHGRIINIVSDAARVGQDKEVVYSAAKGGVISFTKSLAREVGQYGITVNAVSPAATDTPLRRAMLRRLEEVMGPEKVLSREEKIRRAYPMRRIGRPDDTASLVAFLASNLASHITGQICSVNGGFAMPG